MAEEVVLRIETPGSAGEEVPPTEEVQEAEHEIQSEEIEAWSAALKDVTEKQSQLISLIQQGSSQQAETQALIQTQQRLIESLMQQNQSSMSEMLSLVRTMLTPPQPEVVVAETTPPEVAPTEVVPEAVVTSRRFRAI